MLLNVWQRIINVNVPDPDDARRRRLLNIILVGVTSTTVILLVLGLLYSGTDTLSSRFLLFGPLFIGLNFGLYVINRRYSGLLASLIFIGMLTILIVFSDSPGELVAGRSLFFFSIPIVFASVLLRPWMSFAIALACSIAIVILSFQASLTINTFAIGGFLLLALFSWLSATGIDNALAELRNINRELDDRVERRTEELAQANEQLKELDRLRSKFVADVSHELRTPVGNLVAYLEMLEEKMTDPERRKRYLKVLQEETTRLQKMVNSVLNLSRLELGSVKQDFSALDLSEIAEQVIIAHQLRAETHGLKLTYELDKALPAVWADRSQINQVFNNIIGNSVNYTMQDGTVNVKTYSEIDKVVFEVSDTGIGIPIEDFPYLFDRFYRGKNTGSSTIAGTGLGLAITKEIVEAYNGTIEVTSELDKGTIFRIIFPAYSG
jgi:signal transduction histidine kinase